MSINTIQKYKNVEYEEIANYLENNYLEFLRRIPEFSDIKRNNLINKKAPDYVCSKGLLDLQWSGNYKKMGRC
jgi:hypothetical protein